MSPSTLYGIDPGGTTGWVHTEIKDRDLVAKNARMMKPSECEEWYVEMLSSTEPALLIVEDYIIQPKVHNYDHEGDKGVALRLIGGAQLLCRANPHLELVLQGNFRKPAGYGYLGEKYVRGKKGQHILDALAHVMYYAVERRLAEPIALRKGTAAPVRKPSSPRIFRAQSGSQWRRPDKGSTTDT